MCVVQVSPPLPERHWKQHDNNKGCMIPQSMIPQSMIPQSKDWEQFGVVVECATSLRVGKLLLKLLFTSGIRIRIRVIISSHNLYVKEKRMFVMTILMF